MKKSDPVRTLIFRVITVLMEYGYKDLGEYTASYDFTVDSFRFVESHKVDFSRTIYVGLVAKASIAEILKAFELKPALEKVYAHVALGGTVNLSRLIVILIKNKPITY